MPHPNIAIWGEIDPLWGKLSIKNIDEAKALLRFEEIPTECRLVHERCDALLRCVAEGQSKEVRQQIFTNLKKARDILYTVMPRSKNAKRRHKR